jgi:hypothetical protein
MDISPAYYLLIFFVVIIVVFIALLLLPALLELKNPKDNGPRRIDETSEE